MRPFRQSGSGTVIQRCHLAVNRAPTKRRAQPSANCNNVAEKDDETREAVQLDIEEAPEGATRKKEQQREAEAAGCRTYQQQASQTEGGVLGALMVRGENGAGTGPSRGSRAEARPTVLHRGGSQNRDEATPRRGGLTRNYFDVRTLQITR